MQCIRWILMRRRRSRESSTEYWPWGRPRRWRPGWPAAGAPLWRRPSGRRCSWSPRPAASAACTCPAPWCAPAAARTCPRTPSTRPPAPASPPAPRRSRTPPSIAAAGEAKASDDERARAREAAGEVKTPAGRAASSSNTRLLLSPRRRRRLVCFASLFFSRFDSFAFAAFLWVSEVYMGLDGPGRTGRRHPRERDLATWASALAQNISKDSLCSS